jgi:pimeloyl-ACP methyl ester carboxylesterase
MPTARVTAKGTPYTQTDFTPPGGELSLYGMPDGLVGAANVPTILYCHGATGAYNQFTTAGWDKFREAIIDAGWAWIESTGYSGTNWGNPQSIAGYKTAYNYAASNLISVGTLVVLGRSMGGLSGSYLALKDPDISPLVDGLLINSGVQDLYQMTFGPNGATDGTQTAVKNAYGLAADLSDFDAKTSAYDPMKFDTALYAGKKVFWTVGDVDTIVPPPLHGIAQRNRVGHNPAYSQFDVLVGGGHGSGPTGTYDRVLPMLAFLEFVQGKTKGRISQVKGRTSAGTRTVGAIYAHSGGARKAISLDKLATA